METMTRSDLASQAAEAAGINKAQGRAAVDAVFHAIAGAMKTGTEVRVHDFGVFSGQHQEAKTARNPRTGERVAVPARRVPKFRAGSVLKGLVA